MIPRIYIDMDGVCADFNFGLTDLLLPADDAPAAAERLDEGATWKQVFGQTDTEVWRAVDANPREWWENLYEVADRFPKAPLALRLYDAMAAISERTTFLTAIPTITTEDCAAGKIGWIRRRLGRKFKNIHLCAKAEKSDCAATGRVLIDDNYDNCVEFVESGGGALRYWPGTVTGLDQLTKLVNKASTRNCMMDLKP